MIIESLVICGYLSRISEIRIRLKKEIEIVFMGFYYCC